MRRPLRLFATAMLVMLARGATSAAAQTTSADSLTTADSLASVSTTPQVPWWKVPFSSRARLNLQLTSDEATAPWSWDAQSRSPYDQSRFMIDATLGDARVGTLYAKGAATWQDAADAAGHVAFGLEQGDYLFDWSHAQARAFGDERRYFTYDLSDALMDDDVVEDYQHRIGVRVDGNARAFDGTMLFSSLDEGPETRLLSYAKAGVATSPVAASVSYQLQDSRDAEPDHAIIKGEAAAFWKRASAIASIEQSGYGSGVFVPELDVKEYHAAFVELRLARGGVGKNLLLASVYRHRESGTFYQNNLAPFAPPSSSNRLGVYVSHRQYALDGRVVLFNDEITDISKTRGLTASARAFLRDNSEMNLRGALVEQELSGFEEETSGVVHASYRRSLQRFMGGIDALVDDIGLDAATRVGIETRVNWSATGALYLRWIVTSVTERSDAVYARLELRPTARTWVTLAYGRSTTGDGPYFLEDGDAIPTIDTEDVFTVTVRGDF